MADRRDQVLRKRTEIGTKFELKVKVGDELRDVVGTVVEKMSSTEARRRDLTKSKRSGQFLLLEIEGLPYKVGRFRSQVKPLGWKAKKQAEEANKAMKPVFGSRAEQRRWEWLEAQKAKAKEKAEAVN